MNSRKKIFFLSATPKGVPFLKCVEEYNSIRPEIEQSTLQLTHTIQNSFYTTANDIVNILTDDNPWMIHYSGHGDEEEGEWLVGVDSPFFVKNDALIELLEDRGTVKFMFLNSCHSNYLATKINTLVDYVIGFSGRLNDDLAIEFAAKFYSNWHKKATISEAFYTSLKQMGVLGNNKFKPVFHSKINIIMKEFKILMDKHQNLEAAKLEYEERGKLKEDIWEKIKECEMSIQALSKDNNRNLIINQMIESHPYMHLVVWFMEKKEELSRKISNNLFLYQSSKERDYELFSDDLEMLFSRVEDVLISKYHKEDILKKSKLKKVVQNYPISMFNDALDAIKFELPNKYEDDKPYLNSCTTYIKELINN